MPIVLYSSIVLAICMLVSVVWRKYKDDVCAVSDGPGPPIVRTESVDTPVMVQLVNRILADSILEHADKIEILPEPSETHIYYFVAGDKYPVSLSVDSTDKPDGFRISKHIHATVLRCLKAMAEIKYYDQRYPQTGSTQMTIFDVSYHLQVTIDQSPHGETVTIDISRMGQKDTQ